MTKNKKVISITSIFFILFIIIEHFEIISILPISKYDKKNEPVNLQAICEKIQNEQSNKLCFDILKENDFKNGLVLVSREKKYSIEDYPWYDFPFYNSSNNYHNFPGGVKKILEEGRKNNPEQWCKNIYLSYTTLKEDYYFCRAFLENPNFCGKISYFLTGPSKGICYQDAALIWKDPSLCKKADDQEFCYLRMALSSLEDSENK